MPAAKITTSPGLWSGEDDALLRAVPDRVLAKRLNRTLGAVQARREIEHFAPAEPQRRRRTPEEDAGPQKL